MRKLTLFLVLLLYVCSTYCRSTLSKANNEKAVLCGKILDYSPQTQPFTIIYNDILCKNPSEVSLNINKDGTFRSEIDVSCPTVIRIANLNLSFCIAPGEETDITINTKEKKTLFNGYMADINTLFAEKPISTFFINNLDEITTGLNGKDINQYKEYFLNKYNNVIAQIGKYPEKYKRIITIDANVELAACLFQVPSLMKRIYIINNIQDKDEAEKYYNETKIEVPEDFYDCLKDKSFNNSDIYFNSRLGYNLFLFGDALPESKDILSKLYQTNKGVFFDLLTASKIGRQIEDFKPITQAEQEQMKTISDTQLSQALERRNDALLKKLEENKKKTGYTVNEVGDVKNEDLLNSIISKYKGKVILIDFWATWCGPCRMAMKEMLPMKEELKDKDIVYIFLTGETSPLPTWQNMIPDIHGEHFRVTNEQWKYLCKAFNIEGIPTYFITDKTGNIAYRTAGFPGVSTMKEKLLETINK